MWRPRFFFKHFFKFCNFHFELRSGIFWFFLKQIVLKSDFFFCNPPPSTNGPLSLWECLDPPLKFQETVFKSWIVQNKSKYYEIMTKNFIPLIFCIFERKFLRGGSRNSQKERGPFVEGGGLKKKKSDFKTICFKKNQKIPERNSKWKLQNMVKKKWQGRNWNYSVKTRF
jgi:hypothetical protein